METKNSKVLCFQRSDITLAGKGSSTSSELEVYEVFGIGEHASLGSISCIDYPCTTFFFTANEIMLPTDYPNMLRFGENPLQLLITCYLQLLKINRLRGRHQPRCHPTQLGIPH